VKRMRGSAWLAMFGLVGCSTGGPKTPEPSSVMVTVYWLGAPVGGLTLDAGVALDGGWDGGVGLISPTLTSPLRYALLWTTWVEGDGGAGRVLATDDGPLPSLDESFTLRLVMPPSDVAQALVPRESITFASPSLGYTVTVPAYYPRLVIYEDVDQDGSFAPDGLDGPAQDRVLGVAYQSADIAAVLDPEAALKAMPEGSVDRYYAATGGRFTPFVQAGSNSSAVDWQPTLRLTLDGWSYPGLPQGCRRIVADGKRASHAYLVDAAADGVSCAVLTASPEVSACQIVSLQTTDAPTVAPERTLHLWRTARCTRSGDLQLLSVSESVPALVDAGGWPTYVELGICAGTVDVGEATYIAAGSALPVWWPCGSQVPWQ